MHDFIERHRRRDSLSISLDFRLPSVWHSEGNVPISTAIGEYVMKFELYDDPTCFSYFFCFCFRPLASTDSNIHAGTRQVSRGWSPYEFNGGYVRSMNLHFCSILFLSIFVLAVFFNLFF